MKFSLHLKEIFINRSLIDISLTVLMHDIHNYKSQENNLHRSTLISMKKTILSYIQILMRMLMLDLVDSTIDFFLLHIRQNRL